MVNFKHSVLNFRLPKKLHSQHAQIVTGKTYKNNSWAFDGCNKGITPMKVSKKRSKCF